MASLELVVLDFDGTFTRVDDEALPFLAAYRRGLADILGEDVLGGAWDRAAETIEADPHHYGWEHDGRIVAPSHADPYIFATSIAQLLLRERGMMEGPARPAILEELFRAAYAKAATVFRTDARRVIETFLAEPAPVFVVTNSRTDDVLRKIATLGARGGESIPVLGDAKKWMLAAPEHADARFDALPEALSVEGLARPILLKRGHYFDVLRALWERTGTRPERTLVCGDIYELDLALPAALGARVHMVGRPSTPDYERQAVESAGGTFSYELAGVLDHL
jgi:phosphoglycolate phosphatase-like HAD superfamily hydrolase